MSLTGYQSNGSMNRWIVPPQVSPTAKASSSLYPNVTMRRSPVAMMSSASSTTAPSTQPPETDPVTSLSAVTAIAALHEGQSLTLEELREFAEPLLARYKLPLRLHIVDALPRNPAGKVLKFVLKEQLQD